MRLQGCMGCLSRPVAFAGAPLSFAWFVVGGGGGASCRGVGASSKLKAHEVVALSFELGLIETTGPTRGTQNREIWGGPTSGWGSRLRPRPRRGVPGFAKIFRQFRNHILLTFVLVPQFPF